MITESSRFSLEFIPHLMRDENDVSKVQREVFDAQRLTDLRLRNVFRFTS